jgi:hypothetical protein
MLVSGIEIIWIRPLPLFENKEPATRVAGVIENESGKNPIRFSMKSMTPYQRLMAKASVFSGVEPSTQSSQKGLDFLANVLT